MHTISYRFLYPLVPLIESYVRWRPLDLIFQSALMLLDYFLKTRRVRFPFADFIVYPLFPPIDLQRGSLQLVFLFLSSCIFF
jgi:hypothetical protein